MFFRLFYFTPIIGESATLQHIQVLFRCHGNSQGFIYKLSVVYVEETEA